MSHSKVVIKDEHLKLLERLNWEWQDCEYGAPAVNPKRPYGNSSVELDVAEILGWKPDIKCPRCGDEFSEAQLAEAGKLHRELLQVLPLVCLRFNDTGEFRNENGEWVRYGF